MITRRAIVCSLLSVVCSLVLTGCSSGGTTKPTSQYPITRMLDPVTEEVPNVTVD